MSTGTVKLGEDLYRISSCDYSFKVGEKYLVYARWAENNQLIALSCTRTRVLSNEIPDFKELDILNPDAYHAPFRPTAEPTSDRGLTRTRSVYGGKLGLGLTLQQHYRIVFRTARGRCWTR